DWEKATNKKEFKVNTTTREFTEGLIKLRRSTNAFRLGDKELVDLNVTLLEIPEIKESDLVIAYESKSTDNTGDYYVFVNADTEARTLTLGDLDLSKGDVLVDSDEAGTKKVHKKSGFKLTKDTLTIDALTTIVIQVDNKDKKKPNKGHQGAKPTHPVADIPRKK
ncbi:MAG: hypothetical protein R3250_12875, partial [Melioribacteraceae bacterium]|nr:hypothetical protein [Melioribacteraceae bacterium]